MPPRSTRPPTIDSLLPTILNLLTSNPPNPYSAHQKALTTTARLAQSGQSSLAIEILLSVSRELLKLGEAGSGVELGVRMLHLMGESKVALDDKSRASVTQLLALTPPSGPWRKKLADSAVKWSASNGPCATGDPGLHQYIGEMYYKERLFVPAEVHLLASGKRDAANMLAEMMFEWIAYAYPVYLTREGLIRGISGVKQANMIQVPMPFAAHFRTSIIHSKAAPSSPGTSFLSQYPPNILPATAFLTRFLSLLSSPASSCKSIFLSTLPSQTSFSPPDIHLTSSPTLNFLQLALITVQRAPAVGTSGVQARGMDGGIGREWESLVGRYRRMCGAKSFLGDKEVEEILGHISTNVFQAAPRGQQGGDLLQNLMGSLFGGGSASGGGTSGRVIIRMGFAHDRPVFGGAIVRRKRERSARSRVEAGDDEWGAKDTQVARTPSLRHCLSTDSSTNETIVIQIRGWDLWWAD
ncbi:MAG: hypothetical protein TREMPRED_000535 [Tremellales sp. Tagirdzhanova-0007]|nr:MAG: hypothetical protein TREMPRED_000535 [Tremellales sp. Tagirdzhanova-0007]